MRACSFGSLASVALLFVYGCSSDGGSDGGTGGTSATGGAGTGSATSGGASSGGGTGTGSTSGSGSTTGSGGSGTGGSTAAFTCPSGLEGQKPVLSGKSVGTVATAPAFPSGSNSFLEGPVWVGGALYVSQLRDYAETNSTSPAQILKLNGASLEVFIPDAGTNGLALLGGTKVLSANQKANDLVEFDFASPSTPGVPRAFTYMSKKFNSPNDLAIRSDGNVYFTDPSYQCNGTGCGQGSNRVYRVSPSGEVTPITTTNSTPNGIALSLDGSTLYIAGDTEIQKFTLATDGSIDGGGTTFAALSGVDGMTLDCAGNLYASAHSAQKIAVYEPNGTSIGELTVGSNVTNVAFGGPDMKTLFITTYSSKDVRSVDLEVPGLPY